MNEIDFHATICRVDQAQEQLVKVFDVHHAGPDNCKCRVCRACCLLSKVRDLLCTESNERRLCPERSL